MRKVLPASGANGLGLFVILALAALTALTVVPLRVANQALTRAATTTVTSASSVTADSLNRQMVALTASVASFSDRPQLQQPVAVLNDATHPAYNVLAEMRRLNPSVRSAFYSMPDGRTLIVEPANRQLTNPDISKREYFRKALQTDRPVVSGVTVAQSQDRAKLVVVAQAVRRPADHPSAPPLGVIGLTIDVGQYWQSYVDDYATANGVDLQIYDQNNQLAAAPGLGANLGAVVGDARLDAARKGAQRAGVNTINGEEVVAAYSVEPLSGWVLVASADADTVLAPVNNLERSIYVIAAGLLLMLALGAVTYWSVVRSRTKVATTLDASQRNNRLILETAAQGYIEADAAGVITNWNRQAEKIFGWSREEVMGRNLREIVVAPQDEAKTMALIDSLFDDNDDRTRSVRTEAFPLRKGSSERIPIELTMWTMDDDGGTRLSGFVHDISDRRKLEREREYVLERQHQLVEELQEADRVKTDFISTISHELRTPLTSIVGYLEMFTDGYAGPMTERQTSMLNVIDRNSRRLLGLIEDILTLTRIESGQFKLKVAPLRLSDIVRDVELAMMPVATEQRVRFLIQAADWEEVVDGDRDQLERMLLNLVSNAIKFTSAGGSVVLRTFAEGDRVRIEVEDTGIGIPAAEQHQLFTRFFRSTTASQAAIRGTGLGLTIAKGIVDRHSGSIRVDSVEGVGTTVFVELPTKSTARVGVNSAS